MGWDEALTRDGVHALQTMAGADQKRANLPAHRSGHQPRDAGRRVRTSEELLTLAFVDQLPKVEPGNLTIGVAQSWIHGCPLSSALVSRTAARSSRARSRSCAVGRAGTSWRLRRRITEFVTEAEGSRLRNLRLRRTESRSDDPATDRDGRRLGASIDAELGEEVGDVGLHGAGADEQRLGDLPIRVTLDQ